jgi:PAS domain S-box-containing protein
VYSSFDPEAQALALRCCREGVAVVNADKSLVFTTPAWLTMHGYAQDEPPPKRIDDFHTEAQAQGELEPFLQRLAGGPSRMRMGHARRDHSTFETLTAGAPLVTPDGTVRGWVLVADPPASADDLAQAGTFVSSILENLPDMVFVKEAPDLRFVLFNRAGEELLGYKRDELLGKNDYDFFPPAEADFFTSKDREVLAGRHVVDVPEEPIHTREKGLRWLHTKKIPVRDARTGAPRFLLGISEDVTERKRYDDALRVAGERQRVFAETSEALAASLDLPRSVAVATRGLVPAVADGSVLYVAPGGGIEPTASSNPRRPWLEKLVIDVGRGVTRRPRSELVSTAVPLLFTEVTPEIVSQLTPGDPRTSDVIALGARSAMLVPLIARERKLGLLVLWYGESGRRYTESDLEFAVRLARRAAHDIDNARIHGELARARTQAQDAVRARDEFLSIASHELRAPLAALLLQIQSLARFGDREALSPRLREKLTSSERQVKRMTNLVNGLFDMSRIVAGKLTLEPEPADLSAVVIEVVNRFDEEARLHGCDVHAHIDARPVGKWDAMRLEQVVTNLLTNAVKYAPGAPIDVTVAQTDGHARVAVRDHGPGIPADCIDRIFDRFTRVARGKTHGLGLGLYITRQIVRAHGGEIHAENKTDGGAELVVDLPVS